MRLLHAQRALLVPFRQFFLPLSGAQKEVGASVGECEKPATVGVSVGANVGVSVGARVVGGGVYAHFLLLPFPIRRHWPRPSRIQVFVLKLGQLTVGDEVGWVGELVGLSVGTLVGESVGASVGVLVGFSVGTLDGRRVGSCVGELLGFLVGDKLVGLEVGLSVCIFSAPFLHLNGPPPPFDDCCIEVKAATQWP